MTIPAMTAVGSRIGQIQSQFERNVPSRANFAAALQTAQEPAGTSIAVAAMGAPSSEWSSVPIGILGTPVMLYPGSAAGPATGPWIDRLPDAGREWAAEIEQAATDAGLDPRLLAAMVWQESRFQPDAISHSGAIGLAQLMPGTAEGLDVDPFDPVQNLDGGARYLAWTIEEFGSIELGLAAYNAGPGRVREADGIPNIAETQAYVPRVLDYYRQLGGIA